MKVVLSVEPVRFPLTGIGRYTYELARRLQNSPEITDLQFFAGRSFLPGLPSAADASGSGYSLKRAVQKNFLAIEAYRLLMPLLKGRALKGHGDYLYHSPNYYLPPFKGRRVATFHDLSPFTWSQCHPPKLTRYLQQELRLTLKRADQLITDSEFTRRELAEYFDWPIERIDAVPLASSAEFHPRSAAETAEVLGRYGLTYEGYTLFAGTIEPRKNIDTLLTAYERLPLVTRQRWPLVLAGYRGWRNEATFQRIELAQRQGWAFYLGFVPAEELPILFAGARLFAFPSLYEGFGLPVLEAMASGVPVVCSDNSSLLEVAGDAALMCEAMDVESVAQHVAMALEDADWRNKSQQRGIAQASEFSWSRCAAQTLAVYHKALDR
nr:glycosyltransferase family 1 protein [uncultured Pseudomonas sp.]